MQGTFRPQSTDLIPFLSHASSESLKEAKRQIDSFNRIKVSPHILDNETLLRAERMYKKQNSQIPHFLEQCTIWRREVLTEYQKSQVTSIEENYRTLQKMVDNILSLVEELKTATIDSLMEKDDAEVAIDFLMGKMK